MTQEQAALQRVIDRDELRHLLATYCRSIDRGDSELLASVFTDDATILAGICDGSAKAFARDAPPILAENLAMCFHSVANSWFDIEGDEAQGESYVVAFNRTRHAPHIENIVAGRYFDRFTRTNGAWKIRERVFVQDWASARPAEPASPPPDGRYGCFGPNDPLYKFLAK
ncbi:MAG TPA: nuclear transport factor 2 family protein [Sphingopyxis sp.]|nr:nuclear transport factor 2 family protein [Sphingopyxis sp.]